MNRVSTIDCALVIQAVSDYIEQEVDPDLRARMEAHFAECNHCHAILDGTRNIITLIAGETILQIPQGFSARIYSRLESLLK